MKILSLLWGYSYAGIGQAAISYGELDNKNGIELLTIVIQRKTYKKDIIPLSNINSRIIWINSKGDFSWIKKLKDEIKLFKPNFLFVHGFNGPIIGALIKSLFFKNLPMVCSFHGKYHAPSNIKKLMVSFYNWFPVVIYKKYALKVITVCNYFSEYLQQAGVPESKLITIHNGIESLPKTNESNECLTTNNDKIKIGFIGRFDPIKGLNVFVDSLSKLKNEYKVENWEAYLIGDGVIFDQINKQIQSKNLSDIIHLTGQQSNIPEWLNELDIFVLPSFLEAHSISILEAMRAGKAIVATRVGGNPESISNEKEGLLVESNNPIALAEAFKSLIINPELRLKYGTAAKNRFNKEFTEEAMKTKLINCFKAL